MHDDDTDGYWVAVAILVCFCGAVVIGCLALLSYLVHQAGG